MGGHDRITQNTLQWQKLEAIEGDPAFQEAVAALSDVTYVFNEELVNVFASIAEKHAATSDDMRVAINAIEEQQSRPIA